MNARTQRPIPLALTALIALFSAMVALALTGGHDAAAHGSDAHATPAAISKTEFALRQDMRKLWEDHVTWTRLAVISLTTDSPDTQATVARLLRNQTDIGNAIKPFYGAKAGNQLTALLREHILVAADLIAAAKAGDQEALVTEQKRWTANADRIAGLLSKANPRFWKLGAMKTMMHEHLKLTTDEVVARLQGKWAADVRAFDRVHVQILHMSDMLSDGLVGQFPARFR
jgi:acyl-coenzyme A synthetase/AMP-(fatty) acid ligase